MSALSVLSLVLPFPLLFVIHEAEEVLVQHRWMKAHRADLERRFPWSRNILAHLSRLGRRAFAIAALEELLVLSLATCYVLVGGTCSMQVWSALFMAFSLHLLVHLAQAVMVRGYVPGVVTSVLLLPYAAYGIRSILLVMSALELAVWSILGVLMMIVNLRFAHWLGIKIGKP